ncbi:Aldo/keto reductase [Gloeophyllum trabeum ATCC 11539]|uniref:Aldo/keto reductase n=1 Tax=Gloeophyllum trabeum (strain ATCC 11539 / FP-39264 / Madison 617) TaxID=670483 RepID=S7PTZ2_GLOTA|nr:Aldo/keto reductase [Gloeophyllum trabeum ATCC 11539]EPQ50913.1 Aldo/keto reductase [Gloeophyllum trabeum ATCC 11539]
MACPTFKLNNGVDIPSIGLGTWQSKPGEVTKAVEYALKEAGYRHIDCAWAYGNEKEVGAGIRASGVPRSEIFITSKLWGTYHRKVEQCLDETLANLGTDYLDLYLIHWPVPLNPNGNDPVFPKLPDGTRDIDWEWKISDTWKQMEAVYKKGKVKAIGVSNFSEKKLEEILPTAEIVPAVNQLEIHLWNPQHKLMDYLKSKGILPQAYSPLGSTNSPLLQDETATEYAQKYGLQTADILLGYLIAKGIVALPKSVTPARIKSNFDGAVRAASKLTKEDIAKLDAVAPGGKQKRFIAPPWVIDLGFDNWP